MHSLCSQNSGEFGRLTTLCRLGWAVTVLETAYPDSCFQLQGLNSPHVSHLGSESCLITVRHATRACVEDLLSEGGLCPPGLLSQPVRALYSLGDTSGERLRKAFSDKGFGVLPYSHNQPPRPLYPLVTLLWSVVAGFAQYSSLCVDFPFPGWGGA